MDETKKHPGWKEAIDQVLDRVAKDGYGVVISKRDLLRWMDLSEPKTNTPQEWQNYSLKVLSYIENMKDELLTEHNVYLYNVRGEGYAVLHPDDQVEKGPAKALRDIKKHISKAMAVLHHVHAELLSPEGQDARNRNIVKFAFFRTATSRRKFPEPSPVKGLKEPEAKEGNGK